MCPDSVNMLLMVLISWYQCVSSVEC